MILAVPVGLARAGILQRDCGVFSSNSITPRAKGNPGTPPPGSEHPHLTPTWNDPRSSETVMKLIDRSAPIIYTFLSSTPPPGRMISSTELLESLERHNNTFETLLGLIPVKYYIPRDEENASSGSKYHKHVKVSKEVTKSAKRAKVRRKPHLFTRVLI